MIQSRQFKRDGVALSAIARQQMLHERLDALVRGEGDPLCVELQSVEHDNTVITPANLIDNLCLPPPRPSDPLVVALFGLPGSGKSTLARALAERLGFVLLCTDEIRQRYQLPSGPATHEVMYEAAAILIRCEIGLIWDGIHLARRDRDRFRTFADQPGARCQIIYVTASDEAIKQRLAERLRTPPENLPTGIFAITPEHFRQIASFLEVPTPGEDAITVDTTDGLGHELESLIGQLAEGQK